MTKELEFHPLANIFPLMEGEEFSALVADIKANGLRETIILFEGKIIDGRNRYRACLAARRKPQWETYNAQIEDPVAYVISKNIHRRHLTAEQRREIIAKLIAAQPEKSDRAIAEQAKIDKNVVSRVRKKAEATGAVAPVEKRTGKDGKARKAKKHRCEIDGKPVSQETYDDYLEVRELHRKAQEAEQEARAAGDCEECGGTRTGFVTESCGTPLYNAPCPYCCPDEFKDRKTWRPVTRDAEPASAPDDLAEKLRAAEIKILALESEVEDLKREN
jgi:hypothetical protein